MEEPLAEANTGKVLFALDAASAVTEEFLSAATEESLNFSVAMQELF